MGEKVKERWVVTVRDLRSHFSFLMHEQTYNNWRSKKECDDDDDNLGVVCVLTGVEVRRLQMRPKCENLNKNMKPLTLTPWRTTTQVSRQTLHLLESWNCKKTLVVTFHDCMAHRRLFVHVTNHKGKNTKKPDSAFIFFANRVMCGSDLGVTARSIHPCIFSIVSMACETVQSLLTVRHVVCSSFFGLFWSC